MMLPLYPIKGIKRRPHKKDSRQFWRIPDSSGSLSWDFLEHTESTKTRQLQFSRKIQHRQKLLRARSDINTFTWVIVSHWDQGRGSLLEGTCIPREIVRSSPLSVSPLHFKPEDDTDINGASHQQGFKIRQMGGCGFVVAASASPNCTIQVEGERSDQAEVQQAFTDFQPTGTSLVKNLNGTTVEHHVLMAAEDHQCSQEFLIINGTDEPICS
ncbi:uncharacterized protein [Nothobranchius furzeri]|uniref:uncharacterized protein n=1 Tax=Nothobranchius furzeri TaxID=105023 RepID=UPI003904CEA8